MIKIFGKLKFRFVLVTFFPDYWLVDQLIGIL